MSRTENLKTYDWEREILNKTPRVNLIKTSLVKAIEDRRDYVIFDTKHYLSNPKFVQLEFDFTENVLVLDVPLKELSKPEVVRAERVIDKEVSDSFEDDSIRVSYPFDEVNTATEMVENIFRQVFLLPEDYSISVEYIWSILFYRGK